MPDGDRWPERTIAALDLETTGRDPATARCVEIAIVLLGPDGAEVDGGYHTVVDPGVPVPDDAAAVHGITTERAQAEGVPAADAVAETARRLAALTAEGVPVVVFNAPYDWRVLRAEAARHGLDVGRPLLLDPLVVDRAIDRYRKGKRTLGDVARHYGVPTGTAHTARDDACCAGLIAQALARRNPEEVAAPSPEELQERQTRWHAEWRDSFNAYLRRKGADWQVEGDWPG